MSTWLKGVVVAAGTAITALLGGWDKALMGLTFFLAADTVAALLVAIRARLTGQKFDSSTGISGLFKKVGILMAVAGGHAFDSYVIQSDPYVRTTLAMLFMVMEAGSFFGHLANLGVPLPKFLTDILEREILRKRGEAA